MKVDIRGLGPGRAPGVSWMRRGQHEPIGELPSVSKVKGRRQSGNTHNLRCMALASYYPARHKVMVWCVTKTNVRNCYVTGDKRPPCLTQSWSSRSKTAHWKLSQPEEQGMLPILSCTACLKERWGDRGWSGKGFAKLQQCRMSANPPGDGHSWTIPRMIQVSMESQCRGCVLICSNGQHVNVSFSLFFFLALTPRTLIARSRALILISDIPFVSEKLQPETPNALTITMINRSHE